MTTLPPPLSKTYTIGPPNPPQSRKSYAVNFDAPTNRPNYAQNVRHPTKIWLFSVKKYQFYYSNSIWLNKFYEKWKLRVDICFN